MAPPAAVSADMDLNEHYRLLLGLNGEWTVSDVKLDIARRRVDIYLAHASDGADCPECHRRCPLHDHAPERTWRHLDTMQFETVLHASPPRPDCPEHGVKTAEVPWAGKHARFTWLFEAFAIEVIRACRTIRDAESLLRLDWHVIQQIMERAVGRGLARRGQEDIDWVGIDEKSFLKDRRFATLVTDIEGQRVLDVAEGRSAESAETVLGKALTPAQREMVCGAAMDLSAPFKKAVKKMLPNADIVLDRFHVSQLLGDAVDAVRRQEARRLQRAHDKRLAKTRYLWLKPMEHLTPECEANLRDLLKMGFEVGKAWSVKETFRSFWTRRSKAFAESFFRMWHQEALKTALRPVVKVANTLKSNLRYLLNYYDSFISNALTEGFNSTIQAMKADARGYRNFAHYRTCILFFCGGLNLLPALPHLRLPH